MTDYNHSRIAARVIEEQLRSWPKNTLTIDDIAGLVPIDKNLSLDERFKHLCWIMREIAGCCTNGDTLEVRHAPVGPDGKRASSSNWTVSIYVSRTPDVPANLCRAYGPVQLKEVKRAIAEAKECRRFTFA